MRDQRHPDPAGRERAARAEGDDEAAAPTRMVDRMLALWRTHARCAPASEGDPAATLVPAAAPAHGDLLDAGGSDAEDADAAVTRPWSPAPPR